MESENMDQIGNADPILRMGIGSFADRLREVMGTDSARGFSDKIGVSEGSMRAFLKGRIPRADDALAITRATGVTLDWLIAGDGPKHAGEPYKEKNHLVLNNSSHDYILSAQFNEEFALISGYHIQVSAGSGSAWNGEQVKRHLAFRRKWLKYRGLDPERLAVVFAKGDSMQPTINNGDSILVDTSKNQVVDGSIFVLRLGDDLYAKRLQKNIDGGITVISDNRTEYPIQVVHPDQMDSLAVIGKVVWVGHDFL
jgi:phage repressor protein C with HTH and peptisase S24 domain